MTRGTASADRKDLEEGPGHKVTRVVVEPPWQPVATDKARSAIRRVRERWYSLPGSNGGPPDPQSALLR